MHATDFSNPWVTSVDEAPRHANPLLVILAGGVLAVLCLIGGQAAGLALVESLELAGKIPPALADGRLHVLVITVLVFGALVLTALVGARFEGRRLWLAERKPILAILGGLAIGLTGFALVVGLVAIAGVVSLAETPPSPAPLILAGLVLIAIQVAAEELFFRGWIQPVISARWGPWLGVAITALLFAGLHLMGGARGAMALLNLVLAGALFGVLALRSGGLWAPFAAHFGWNSLEAIGLGLEPDPGVGPFGALVNLELEGLAQWSGGDDRLNGSLATTLVLLALVLLLAVWGPARVSRSAPPAARRSGRAP